MISAWKRQLLDSAAELFDKNHMPQKQMIEPELLEASISHRCRLLGLGGSSFYYVPRPIDPEDLKLTRLIDEQSLNTPT